MVGDGDRSRLGGVGERGERLLRNNSRISSYRRINKNKVWFSTG